MFDDAIFVSDDEGEEEERPREEEGVNYHDRIFPEDTPTPPEVKPVPRPISFIDITLEYIDHCGNNFRPGKTAELVDGTFIQIKSIVERHRTDYTETLLIGPCFKRCRSFEGLFPSKLNEVAMFSSSKDVSISRILRPRILIRTNASWPKFNDIRGYTKEEAENSGKLVCRWEATIPVHTSTRYLYTGVLRRLREDEVDPKFRVSDRKLRRGWRGPQDGVRPGVSEGNRYTFGDSFCGGGGMSCGAQAAGFETSWGFDFDKDACNTYRRNFPSAQVFMTPVDLFVTAFAERELQVDVIHLSPPCQPHSPAHTVPGKNDDENEAAGLCIGDILQKIRPRYATLEQTDGIIHRPEWFNVVMWSFVSAGFSVTWKVLQCVQYGTPQTRKRLFIMAACPGELLPTFPEPIYAQPNRVPTPFNLAQNHGLLPPRTLGDAIGHLDPDADLIDERNGGPHLRFTEPRATPNRWDEPLRNTIKAGSGNYDVHPSFLRRFTVRELACLQTFPDHHEFCGIFGMQRRQVGNAVPPVVGAAILGQVRKALEASDANDVDMEDEEDKEDDDECMGAEGGSQDNPLIID
ncbi:S-adenosyl-L-methionine-dependent methyltransferase [Pyronema domesticum]|uniref:DNA (cytosine-5-)-methyltransferase n=1 Tax=Pyronema omphalodes (strain CBS 100304) TaxID=1076935 RepID=U4L335_PYROM|nr:S-adenosyl-L-methionine-dependent methyltransferase [Pyronema domesticum]CCX06668.1 Similar to Modification methylase XorII; acc. no. P52311 [Pyronema omphalodes CBS 100304]